MSSPSRRPIRAFVLDACGTLVDVTSAARRVWLDRDRLPIDRLPRRPERVPSDLAELPDLLETC